MAEQNSTGDKAASSDIARYRTDYLSEQEGIYLYSKLADIESDAHLAELYRRLVAIEQRHADLWKDYLTQAGETLPTYTPDWRVRTLLWIARRLGTGAVLSTLSSMEKNAVTDYDSQPEAVSARLPADERSHARLFSYLLTSSRGGIAGPLLAQFEGRHRSAGGNELRAAVLGASDGLTSNLSLVMGVAGATLTGHTVLFAGVAGLLAGAFSMSIGEWVSVQSARELNLHQITIERQEIRDAPQEEQEELALIYQAKGLDEKTARELAAHLMQQSGSALDTLAREELGIDPGELGGSAWGAAITSFFLFAIGAIIPVFPFIFTNGFTAVIISLILSVFGLFGIGAGVSLTASSPLWQSGGRQILLGLLAAGFTFGLGKLIGSAVR
ncbi:MAG TPA: VIT1/CCC1 transporter family protein [Ktedonobacteraceae bacterium]|nr:VIT1/CCC1 transporter family protein [Ktedonobacteraceae bacterium]